MAKKCTIPKGIFDGIKITAVTASGEGRKKPMGFDIFQITNNVIYDVFFAGGGKAVDALMSMKNTDGTGIITNSETYKKIFKNISKTGAKNAVLTGIDTTTDAETAAHEGMIIEFRSISLNEILNAMESEFNVQNNLGINDEAMVSTLYNNDGSRKVNAMAVAQTVGKKLAEHQGFKFQADPITTNERYQEFGMFAMKELESAGLIRITENDSIINPSYYDGTLKKVSKQNKLIIDGYPTVSIVTDSLLDEGNKGDTDAQAMLVHSIETNNQDGIIENEIASDTINGVKALDRLVTPSNMKAPLTDMNDVNKKDTAFHTKDLGFKEGKDGVTDNTKKLFKELQTKTNKINPIMNGMLIEMNKILSGLEEIDPTNPEATLKNMYKKLGIRSPTLQNKIFGAFSRSTHDDFKSKIGQSISKENPLMQLIMFMPELVNEDGSSKPFYNELGLYRTTRMENLATFLNEQMDKNFSRYMIQGDPITVDTNSEFGKKLLNRALHSLIDQTGLNVEQIRTPGHDETIDYLLERFEANFINADATVEGQVKFLQSLANKKIGDKSFNMKGGVFDNLSAIHAMYDIRNAKKGKISTAQRTFLDASASGLMLSFMQNIGKSSELGNAASEDRVYEMMDKLGYTKDKIDRDPELKDAYYILIDQVRKASANKDNADSKTLALMTKLADLGMFKNIREISKPMTMVTNYQAGDATAIASTSADLRVSVIDALGSGKLKPEGVKFVKEMIKTADEQFYNDNNVGNISAAKIANLVGINKAVETYFTNELSGALRGHLDSALEPVMGDYKKRVNTTYAHLEKVFMEDANNIKKDANDKVKLSVIPLMAYESMTNAERTYPGEPGSKEFAAHHAMLLEKYGMPLTSRRQALTDAPKGGNALILKEVPNTLTASVNTIHGEDAGIFFKSHQDTLDEMRDIVSGKTKGYTKDEVAQIKISLDNASGMIHDANNADMIYNYFYQNHYNRNSVEASENYDIEEQLALTYLSYKDANGEYSNDLGLNLYKRAMENVAKKKAALKDIPKDTSKFFGFPDTEPVMTEDEVVQETVEQTPANDEQITKHLTVEEGQRHYDNINKILNTEGDAYVIDAETTGFMPNAEVAGKKNKIVPSSIFQVSARKLVNGKPTGESKTFYFPVSQILQDIQDLTGFTPAQVNAAAKKNGHNTPNKAMKAFIEYVNGAPLLGFNSEFDMNSLKIMLKDMNVGDLVPLDLTVNDIGKAKLFEEAIIQDEFVGETGNKLVDVFERTATDAQKQTLKDMELEAHNADADTYMTQVIYETLGTQTTLNFDAQDNTAATGNRLTDKQVMNIVEQIATDSKVVKDFIAKYGMDKIVLRVNSDYNIDADIVALTNDGDLTIEQLTTQLEHEIIHQQTAGFLGAFENDPDVQYIRENMEKIKNRRLEIESTLNDEIKGRLGKVFDETNPDTALLEMVAILQAEPNVRNAVADAIKSKALVPRIYRLIKKISKWAQGKDFDIDFEQLVNTLNNVVESGKAFNENTTAARKGRAAISKKVKGKLDYNKNGQEAILDRATAYKKNKAFTGKDKSDETFPETAWNTVNNYSGIFVGGLVTNYLEPRTVTAIEKADKYLSKESKIYKKNRDNFANFLNSNDSIASMKGYLDRARVGDLMALNKLETIQMNAEQQVRFFEDNTISKLNKLMNKAKNKGKKLTTEDKIDMNRVMAQTPMFHLINEFDDLQNILNSKDRVKEIDNMITALKKGLKPSTVRDINELALILAKKKPSKTTSFYNIEQMKITDGSRQQAERLLGLITLKNSTGFENGLHILSQNKDLASELIALSAALRDVTLSIIDGTQDKNNFRENLMYEQFENAKEFRAVDIRDIGSREYSEKKGWKVLRQPTADGYGVIWRDRSKVTRQEGAGTSVDFKYYDIMVDERIKKEFATNAVAVQNGTSNPYHKVVLTEKELQSFDDLIANPADSLARAYAQMLMIQQTKAARDYLVMSDKIFSLDSKDASTKLDKKIGKVKPEKHPWMISIPDGMNVTEFLNQNPNIKRLYKQPEFASSVNDFNQKFDLVRKDMHDMLTGYADPELFENNNPMKAIAYTVRQGVVMIKTHWIVVNPVKIANDLISNNIILGLKGVPMIDVAKDQVRAFKLGKQMADMRSDLVSLEFEIMSYSDLAKNRGKKRLAEAKRDRLVKKIQKHEFAPLYQNGMMQSMSTDILRKDESVVAGLQKDVEKIFNMVLKDADGKSTGVEKAVRSFANAGWQVDDLLRFAGKSLKNFNMLNDFGNNMGDALTLSGKRIKNKKAEKDMAKYMSEFIASPDSELVRLGSYLVQMTDIASRYTLYKHLMKNRNITDIKTGKARKRTEEEIVLEVLETFVDYKVNMPKELKVLSDYGVILFPSFWLRIQKVMYALAKENPAKVAAGITLTELMDVNVESYFNSNIFAKFGGIVNVPPLFTDPLSAVIPADLYQELLPYV